MTIWRVFGPEYTRDVKIVRLKVWFLLEITERQLLENTEAKNDKNSKKKDKKAHILPNIYFAL